MKLLLLVLFVFCTSMAMTQSYRAMTYNIRFDNPGDGVNAWPERKNRLYALIRKHDPDLIGVQEALLHQLEDIKKALPEYDFRGAGRDDGKNQGEFSAILYKKKKFSVIDQNTFWLSETPDVPGSKDWDAAITRVATWIKARDNKTGKHFFMINTHFDHMGKEARSNSASLLKTRTGALAEGLPIIVTGDLNCTRDEQPYKTLINDSGLRLLDPAPADAPGTFCNFEVNSMVCRPIDYIFHSGGWTASEYTVITDNNGKYYPSDHLPVIVTLSPR